MSRRLTGWQRAAIALGATSLLAAGAFVAVIIGGQQREKRAIAADVAELQMPPSLIPAGKSFQTEGDLGEEYWLYEYQAQGSITTTVRDLESMYKQAGYEVDDSRALVGILEARSAAKQSYIKTTVQSGNVPERQTVKLEADTY